jgi:hypothetical protein
MGRALVAVGALLALCFAVLGIAVFASRTEDRVAIDGPLSERITRAIALASRQDGEVDLARIATFPWDRALIVEPGTPRSRISDALGFEWKGDVGFQTGELLVFVDGQAVARFADYRGEGRFAGLRRPIHELARDRAVFTVRGLVVRPRPVPGD